MANRQEMTPQVYDLEAHAYQPLSAIREVKAFFTQNELTQEVWYTGRHPDLVFGRIFRLQMGAHLSAMRDNIFAHTAITLAEASIHKDFTWVRGSLGLIEDAIPQHVLDIANWFDWNDLIGSSEACTVFEKVITGRQFDLPNLKIKDIPILVIHGMSFNNAIWASSELNEKGIKDAHLALGRDQYFKLMQPFGVVNFNDYQDIM